MSLFGSKYRSHGQSTDSDVCTPQMTSLIDILTLMLVFLIQSFSAEGALVTPSTDLQLPTSSSTIQPKPALTVEITKEAVAAEGEVLVPIKSFANNSDMLVSNVYKWALNKKRLETDTAGPLKIIIQCDKDVVFNVVKRVMYTCSKAGYSDFSVLVIQD